MGHLIWWMSCHRELMVLKHALFVFYWERYIMPLLSSKQLYLSLIILWTEAIDITIFYSFSSIKSTVYKNRSTCKKVLLETVHLDLWCSTQGHVEDNCVVQWGRKTHHAVALNGLVYTVRNCTFLHLPTTHHMSGVHRGYLMMCTVRQNIELEEINCVGTTICSELLISILMKTTLSISFSNNIKLF